MKIIFTSLIIILSVAFSSGLLQAQPAQKGKAKTDNAANLKEVSSLVSPKVVSDSADPKVNILPTSEPNESLGFPTDYGINKLPRVASDQRPIIVVPLAFSNMPMHVDMNLMDNSLFGDNSRYGVGFPNFITYLRKVSLGHVEVRREAFLPTLTLPQRRSQNSSDLERGKAIEHALNNGINLMEYDTNGDGILTEQEVLFLSIIADAPGTGGGGAVRTYCGNHQSSDGRLSANFCGRIASMSEYASLGVAIHEILHLFGAGDMYSMPWEVHNGATNMANPDIIYPDPWFRIKLGWISPRTVDLDELRRTQQVECYNMPSNTNGEIDPNRYDGPLKILDSANPNGDYLLGEFRIRAGMDRNVGDEGYAFWYVSENSSGTPQFIPIAMIRRGSSGQVREGDDENYWAGNTVMLTTPGVNGVLDTPLRSPDSILYASPTVFYPPPHTIPNHQTNIQSFLGVSRQFWKADPGTVSKVMEIKWPDVANLRGGPRSTGMGVRIPAVVPSAENMALVPTYGSVEIGPLNVLRARASLPICEQRHITNIGELLNSQLIKGVVTAANDFINTIYDPLANVITRPVITQPIPPGALDPEPLPMCKDLNLCTSTSYQSGPQGPQGPAGSMGPTGMNGPNGPQGPLGPMGKTGNSGPSGGASCSGPNCHFSSTYILQSVFPIFTLTEASYGYAIHYCRYNSTPSCGSGDIQLSVSTQNSGEFNSTTNSNNCPPLPIRSGTRSIELQYYNYRYTYNVQETSVTETRVCARSGLMQRNGLLRTAAPVPLPLDPYSP